NIRIYIDHGLTTSIVKQLQKKVFCYTTSAKPLDIDYVYRGINLEPATIDAYKAARGRGSYRWLSFTSTTKNRQYAEFRGTNSLCIMFLKKLYGGSRASDIAWLSQFPEEEVLLQAGVGFQVDDVIYNSESAQHTIYLTIFI
ncbi:unnamed protein product, partial [Rotaria sp. Silwood2]